MNEKINNSEDALKKAANLYSEEYGQSLLRELEEMRSQNVSYMMPRADAVALNLIKENAKSDAKKKNNRILKIVSSLAACLVVVIAVSQFIDFQDGQYDSSAPGAPDVDSSYPGDTAEAPAAETPSAEPPEPPGLSWDEIQPISFTLPEGFEVSRSELDNGKTIHHLESSDSNHPDDVVLTISRPDGDEDFLGTETINIDGQAVNTKVDDGYLMLLFENNGRLYTLSTERDMDALTILYREAVST